MTGHRLCSFCGERVLLIFTNNVVVGTRYKHVKQRDQDFQYPRSGHMISRAYERSTEAHSGGRPRTYVASIPSQVVLPAIEPREPASSGTRPY